MYRCVLGKYKEASLSNLELLPLLPPQEKAGEEYRKKVSLPRFFIFSQNCNFLFVQASCLILSLLFTNSGAIFYLLRKKLFDINLTSVILLFLLSLLPLFQNHHWHLISSSLRYFSHHLISIPITSVIIFHLLQTTLHQTELVCHSFNLFQILSISPNLHTVCII